ncbi:hypothetical protein SUDANB1_05602 [Streptomyces sp. enrichment culture]|uniref:hypothetical protein n=1 Tax=Streptomyces sp. enrichment culture TaxID=1795815 RepID=UPI003F55CFDF
MTDRPMTLIQAAEQAHSAAAQHITSGCTTCTPDSVLDEMCAEGKRLVLRAVHGVDVARTALGVSA